MNLALNLINPFDFQLSADFTAAVVVTGLVVVFAGLLLLIGFVYLLGFFFTAVKPKIAAFIASLKPKKKEEEPEKTVATEVKVNKTVPVSNVEDGISDEVVAVISAAVAAMSAESGKPMVIKSVTKSRNQRPVWSAAGLADNTRPF